MHKAILRRGSKVFEIIVNAKEAYEYKTKRIGNIEDILLVIEIFKDAEKGMRYSNEELQKEFGTSDKIEVAKIILEEGELQIPSELKKELIEKKKRQIADLIARNAIDARTKMPIPLQRILNLIEEAGISVDFNKPAEEQVDKFINALRTKIPLVIATAKLSIKIPPKYAGIAHGKLKGKGKILKEIWNDDGSYSCIIEIPAGIKGDLYESLASLTHGEVEIKELEENKL